MDPENFILFRISWAAQWAAGLCPFWRTREKSKNLQARFVKEIVQLTALSSQEDCFVEHTYSLGTGRVTKTPTAQRLVSKHSFTHINGPSWHDLFSYPDYRFKAGFNQSSKTFAQCRAWENSNITVTNCLYKRKQEFKKVMAGLQYKESTKDQAKNP